MKARSFFSNNQLKLIALVAMTIDHVGAYLFPDVAVLRIIGRLAFPIFAYMVAEGCLHTRSRVRYLLTMGGAALVFQIAAFFVMGTLRQYVLTTFFLSLVLCLTAEYARKKSGIGGLALLTGAVVAIWGISELLPEVLEEYVFRIDYGFLGVLFPVAVFIAPEKRDKLFAATVMTFVLALTLGGVQWYSLAALPLLMLYNGERGKVNLKYLFYAYFPLHLIVIKLVEIVMGI